MRKMTTAVALAALIAGWVGSGPASAQTRATPAPTPESAVTVRQITLVVEDIDRAADFYQRLGLTKIVDRTNSGGDGVYGATDLPLTADPTVSRFVVVRGANGATIALLGYDKPKLASARGNLAALGTGDAILVLDVPEVSEVYRRLSQIGTHFFRTPARFTEGGESGQRMMAFDPDGHLIEVRQLERK